MLDYLTRAQSIIPRWESYIDVAAQVFHLLCLGSGELIILVLIICEQTLLVLECADN